MFTFTLRRLAFAVPTLLVISFVIFALLDLAPNDPTGDLPLTIPPDVREQIRASLGLDQPFFIRYLMWLQQFFINEPLNLFEKLTGWQIGDGSRMRVLSWATRSPVVDLVIQRMPQTLWVVGLAYLFGALLAIPIGVISAYKQYSIFDQIGTFVSMVGYSVPTFFTGVLLVVIFSSYLQWFPSVYDTNLQVTDWGSFVAQIKQMFLPVLVLTLYNVSQISRFVRASMLDNLHQDYVRTARAKGVKEKSVLLRSRAAQQPYPGRHRHSTWRADNLFRRHHHRADFPCERAWPIADNRRSGRGYSAGADADLHFCGADRALQPDCRRALRHSRPEDPL